MPLPARLRRGPGAPLWRAAPTRLLRDPAGLVLMAVVMSVVGLTAAAGPLHGEAVGDGALRSVLDAVPARAPANQQPVVRLNASVGPGNGAWDATLADLEAVPGLGAPRTTAQSISTELHPRLLYDPVGPQLRGPRGRATTRLFAVADPASELVPVRSADDEVSGVWVPDPVAVDLGLAPGDVVRVRLTNLDDAPAAVSVPVAGTYAVAADGRTPRPAPGSRTWARLADEGFPSDPELSTLRAHLVVADLDTVASLAAAIGDDLLWSSLLPLADPQPRLADTRRTALAVRDVRLRLAGRTDLGDLPASLRPGLASGIEDLVDEADTLAAATRRGTAVTTRAGLLLGLVLVLAATSLVMARRRREVALAAGVGRHPVSSGLLHAVELAPVALVGGAVGWLVAGPLVGLAVPGVQPSAEVERRAALWALGSVVAGTVVAAVVAGAATRTEARRLTGRPSRRVPWVVVVVVAAASATAGLVTRPAARADPLGPLDLLVPPLLVAAVAAVGTRLGFTVLRLLPAAGKPRRGRLAGWLARRRLRALDPARELATVLAAVGLGVLVYSVTALVSLQDTVTDRVAVEVGADTVHRVGDSWLLDPDAPVQAELGPEGQPPNPADVPDARVPPLPPGLSTVWRSRAVVATTGLRVDVLAVDPATVDAAADWGAPDGPVSRSRRYLDDLAGATPSAPVPALLVGRVRGVDLDVGSLLTLDTSRYPIIVEVVARPDAFPGVGSEEATLVVDADTYLGELDNDDPRLRPGPQSQFVDTYEFRADLWAAPGADWRDVLDAAQVAPDLVASAGSARATPAWVSATESRRYQVGLGVLLGLLGLVAVALAAVRAARRAPAADRMLALAGARGSAPRRARTIEVVVVVLVCAVLAVVAVLALSPLGPVLLEPGDGGRPEALLRVPPVAWAVAGGWVAATLAVALLATTLAAGDRTSVEVLRGED